MVFKKWNIVYLSKKVYNDLKNIEKNIEMENEKNLWERPAANHLLL